MLLCVVYLYHKIIIKHGDRLLNTTHYGIRYVSIEKNLCETMVT